MLQPADSCPGAEDYLVFARDRDPAALDRVLRACADRAYTQARRTLGNGADADDAVQEAFLQLARTAPRYDGSVPFGAWLGRLVRMACLLLLRSDGRRRRREEAIMAHPAPVEDPDRAEEVRALVARLPAGDRAAVELHYFAGLPQAEVAAALGSSENAVALRLSRARARLRSLLGGGASLAAVASLLAAQTAHAAPPQVLAGITPLISAVAAGAALPATTVQLSVLQKGLLFMSTHPFAAAAILLALLGAGLLPIALAAGEARPAPPPPVAGTQPWQGKARELLPFLDPAATLQLAVDGAHVRQLALAAKPTSLLADPRAQPAMAHIREQFRLWRAAGGGAPDWAQVIAEADGMVLGYGRPSGKSLCLVAELGTAAASQLQGMWEESFERNLPPVSVGGFSGVHEGNEGEFVVRDGGRWALAADIDLLTAGLARRTALIPPAGLWARVDLGDAVATLARMDPVADPFGLSSLFGSGWRRLRPSLSSALSTAEGRWRAETRLSGAGRLPLRAAHPSIAGCVPADATASLLLGCDPASMGAIVAPFIEPRLSEALLAQLRRLGIDPAALPGQLSGDLALIVRQRASLPEVGLVLGLRPGAAATLRGGLDKLATASGLASEPAVAPALAAWSGLLPIGNVQVRLAADRLVASTGDAAALLAPSSRQVDAALVVDVDVPVLARTWLPQLLALLPAKPKYFGALCPLVELSRAINTEIFAGGQSGKPLDLDQMQSPSQGFMQAIWRRLVGKDLPMQPHLAVYGKSFGEHVFVLRRAEGWRVIGWHMRTYDVVADREALDRRLAGLPLRAGTPAAQLATITFPDPPTIDRSWLPPLPVILDHLPPYQLRIQPTADGFVLHEAGVPFAGPLLITTATLTFRADYLARFRGEAVLRRDGPALRQRHARAIAALQRTGRALASRSSQADALLTPSALLAAAGIDPAELASLCDGVSPDAARVDRLGFFHPSGWPHHHFGWLIPLADGLFLECHRAKAGGCDLTSSPFTPQRPATAEELARLRRPDGAVEAVPDPAPVAPAGF